MAYLFKALALALRDLARPAVWRLIVKSIVITLIAIAAFIGLFISLFRWLSERSQWLSAATMDMASVLIFLLMLAAAWFVFRAAAIFVIGIFADDIVEDVEARHYPDAARDAVSVGIWRSGRLALKSLGRFLGVNLIALPLYIALLPTGLGLPILALILNAWLLGFDLEAMVRARHLGLDRLSLLERWGLGLLSAASLSIPIVNFLAPVMSASMAVHLFHLRSRGSS
jgi:uncharacterized protein involved in cysteine biosynthesis